MAHQAIDVRRIVVVESRVLPTVADMTAGAARPVRRNRDTEIIDEVLFPELNHTTFTGVEFRPEPFPMPGRHHVGADVLMTCKAGFRYLLRCTERPFDKVLVVLRVS